MALEKNIGHSVETFLRKVAGDLSSHCQISLFWKPSHTFTMLFKTQSSYTTFQGISLIKYPSKEFSSHRNFLIQHTHPHTKFFLILNVGMSLHLLTWNLIWNVSLCISSEFIKLLFSFLIVWRLLFIGCPCNLSSISGCTFEN